MWQALQERELDNTMILILIILIYIITVTLHERWYVSNRSQIGYLFKTFSKLTTMKTQKRRIIGSLWRKSHIPCMFPNKGLNSMS